MSKYPRRDLGQMSFLRLLVLIALIGYSLPFIQMLGNIHCGMQSSISATWYTCMRDFFVGSLCLCGGFFVAYKGYDFKDDAVFNLIGLCFFFIAFFPCEQNISNCSIYICEYLPSFHPKVHYIAATILFINLGLVCKYLFTSSDCLGYRVQKNKRNNLYNTCGNIIFACIVVLLLSNIFNFFPFYTTYVLEIVMLYSFCTAFITKGTSGKIFNIHDEAS